MATASDIHPLMGTTYQHIANVLNIPVEQALSMSSADLIGLSVNQGIDYSDLSDPNFNVLGGLDLSKLPDFGRVSTPSIMAPDFSNPPIDSSPDQANAGLPSVNLASGLGKGPDTTMSTANGALTKTYGDHAKELGLTWDEYRAKYGEGNAGLLAATQDALDSGFADYVTKDNGGGLFSGSFDVSGFADQVGDIASDAGNFIDPTNTSASEGLGNVVGNLDPTTTEADLGNIISKVDPTTEEGQINLLSSPMPMSGIPGPTELVTGLDNYSDFDPFNPDSVVNDFIGDELKGDEIGDAVSDAGDFIAENAGLTEGDAANAQFEAIWPYKQEVLDAASDLFASDDPLNPAFSQDTQDYISGVRARATDGSPLVAGAETELAGLFGSSNPALDTYGKFASGKLGQNNPAMAGYQGIMGRTGQNPVYDLAGNLIDQSNPTNQFANQAMGTDFYSNNPSTQFFSNNAENLAYNPALQELSRTASGGYLGSNPFLDATFDRAAQRVSDRFTQDILPATNNQASLMGRTGSNYHERIRDNANQGYLDSLNDLALGIYGGNYDTERGRMLDATSRLGSVYDTGIGRTIGAFDRLGQNYGQGIDTQFRGAGLLSGNYQSDQTLDYQGANILGNQYNTDTGNLLNATQGVGSVYQQGINNQFQGLQGQSGAYNQDFANSLNTINPSLALGNQDYTNLSQLGLIGGLQDTQNKAVAGEGWQKVGLYNQAIGGIPSGSGQPQQGSPLFPLIGAGLGAWLAPPGAGIAGASLGAGLGGLFS